jgi:hypothetical protein
VRRRIVRRNRLVPAFAQHFTRTHQNGADRHLPLRLGTFREFKRPTHPTFVVGQ